MSDNNAGEWFVNLLRRLPTIMVGSGILGGAVYVAQIVAVDDDAKLKEIGVWSDSVSAFNEEANRVRITADDLYNALEQGGDSGDVAAKFSQAITTFRSHMNLIFETAKFSFDYSKSHDTYNEFVKLYDHDDRGYLSCLVQPVRVYLTDRVACAGADGSDQSCGSFARSEPHTVNRQAECGRRKVSFTKLSSELRECTYRLVGALNESLTEKRQALGIGGHLQQIAGDVLPSVFARPDSASSWRAKLIDAPAHCNY